MKISNTVKLIASTTLAAVAGTAAVAQSSWDGFYVGGAVNTFPASVVADGSDNDINGVFPSVFGGYNISFGSIIAGAEVNAFGAGAINTTGGSYDTAIRSMIDLKGRAGTTFGDALVYASVGYSFGTSTNERGSQPFDGMNYGVGVDYMISDNFFVGAEYVRRVITDDNYFDAAPLSSVSIRAGYKF